MSFADRVLDFHTSLKPNWKIPKGFDLIYPFDQADTWACMQSFYHKYFADDQPRVFIFGINPGRFGAGVTGVAFTDPFALSEFCDISSPFPKRKELSSIFIYEVIEAFGGAQSFYSKNYITSLCPLGFLKDGINCNYYDDKKLLESVEPKIISNLKQQTKGVLRGSKVVCLGMGKNYKYFKKLNDRIQLFEEVIPLPHPRWIMQYRRKEMKKYLSDYLHCLEKL